MGTGEKTSEIAILADGHVRIKKNSQSIEREEMQKLFMVGLLGFCLFFTLLSGCLTVSNGAGSDGIVSIGHTSTPLLAELYVATDRGIFEERGVKVELTRFGSTSEIGYALLSGDIDVGFIEPLKSFNLINVRGREGIKVAGTVSYPYGATLVVRKGLNIRLGDLEGRIVAASAKDCVLLHQFKRDAERFGVDAEKINFVYMEFDTMLPALEAKKVDAAIFKAVYAMLAEFEGHSTLYQNWEVKPGDACCPAYLAYIEYFMLVQGLDNKTVNQLIRALEVSSNVLPEESREAIAKYTGFPEASMRNFPLAAFARLNEGLKKELKEDWVWQQ